MVQRKDETTDRQAQLKMAWDKQEQACLQASSSQAGQQAGAGCLGALGTARLEKHKTGNKENDNNGYES